MGINEVEEFPKKLMEFLTDNKNSSTDESNSNLYPHHTICWTSDGKAFAFDRKTINDVLANYFNGIKYDSFLRKLRRWGFKRVLDSDSFGSHLTAYYHPLFQRES